MQPYRLDIDPADVDTNGIAEDQTTAGAGNLTLNGALADLGTAGQFDIGDSYSSGIGGVQIGIESTGNLSGVTFTVTGKDQDGISTTEAITGPNNTTVESSTYWSQITQIAVDGAVGTNVEVGPVDEIITRTLPINWRATEACTAAVTQLSGTCQFDIDETFDDVNVTVPAITTAWITKASNQSANVAQVLTIHATAVRLKFDSYTNGAELQLNVIQGNG